MKRVKQEHKPRRERQNDVILTAHSMWADGKKTFTNAKMARRLGMAVSSHLKSMLEELVSEGWLERTEKVHRSSINKDGYSFEIIKHVYRLTEVGLNQLAIL